ncbi:unnamed protein product [Peniophora sp. CBMAI 1063]|nr:unnamed protein product [Peniophora sp. CBMAI 1063]
MDSITSPTSTDSTDLPSPRPPNAHPALANIQLDQKFIPKVFGLPPSANKRNYIGIDDTVTLTTDGRCLINRQKDPLASCHITWRRPENNTQRVVLVLRRHDGRVIAEYAMSCGMRVNFAADGAIQVLPPDIMYSTRWEKECWL